MKVFKERYFWCGFCVITILFLVIFNKIVFGGYAYMYADIGCDTINIAYPSEVFEQRVLAGEIQEGYSLQYGLGTWVSGGILKFLNLFNFCSLFLGEQGIALSITISLILKTLITYIFAYMFFDRLLKYRYSTLICAVLWTFSSYIVIWSQHYGFTECIAYFTIIMYFLQRFIEEQKSLFWMVFPLVLMAFCNYYFLYMTGLFCVIYICLWGYFHHTKFNECFRLLLKLAGSAIFAIGISAIKILPSLLDFFASSRTGDMVRTSEGTGFIYSLNYLISFVGRFFSNNLLGIGSNYSGAHNYYEVAVLCTSLFFVFCFWILVQTKYRKNLLVGSVVALLALCMPLFSTLLTANSKAQRWSFMLCFMMVITMGVAIREIFCGGVDRLYIRHASIYSVITYGILLMCLVIAHKYRFITLDKKVLGCVICILFFYTVWCFFYMPGRKKTYAILLLFMLFGEAVITNYPSINDRPMIPGSDVEKLYADGTEKVVDQIKDVDHTLYRINKSYMTVFYNDAMIQNYNGLSSYTTTHSEELVNFSHIMDLPGFLNDHPNFIRVPFERYYLNALMGTKYLIAYNGTPVGSGYTKLFENEKFTAYENNAALNFGYLYKNQISKQAMDNLIGAEKDVALLQGYYITDGSNTNGSEYLDQLQGINSYNAMKYLVIDQDNITAHLAENDDGLFVEGVVDDMQVNYNIDEDAQINIADQLTINITAEKDSVATLYYAQNNENFSENNSLSIEIYAGENQLIFDLSRFDHITNLRFDPSSVKQNVIIHSVKASYFDKGICDNSIKELKAHSLEDVQLVYDTISGRIDNMYGEESMLCIPVIYSDHWNAFIDGVSAEILNINGGLVGVVVPSGTHDIQLVYEPDNQELFIIISVLFCLGTIMSYLLYKRLCRKN